MTESGNDGDVYRIEMVVFFQMAMEVFGQVLIPVVGTDHVVDRDRDGGSS